MRRARQLALTFTLLAVPTLASAQQPAGVRPHGPGNAENVPAVFTSWSAAQSATETAQNDFHYVRDQYRAAKRAYDDLNDSGGMSTDKATKLDALRRKKDDAYRDATTKRLAYLAKAQGAVNFATKELAAAKTDADKSTASSHKSTAQRWLDESKNGF